MTASARRGGKRWYDREQLRRIAFVQIGRQLGMTLDDLGEILDGPEHRWRGKTRWPPALRSARMRPRSS